MIGKLWEAYEVISGQEKKDSEMTSQYVCLIKFNLFNKYLLRNINKAVNKEAEGCWNSYNLRICKYYIYLSTEQLSVTSNLCWEYFVLE